MHGEPALVLDAHGGPQQGFSVTIESVAASGTGLLTGAQHTVARHVAAGDSDREIAAALHLSVATVHEHVAALHRLLDTRTRPRLVAALAGTAFGRPHSDRAGGGRATGSTAHHASQPGAAATLT